MHQNIIFGCLKWTSLLHDKFVVAPADKSSNNIVFTYIQRIGSKNATGNLTYGHIWNYMSVPENEG